MEIIEYCRWASKEEMDSFNQYKHKKNTDKDNFTREWLVENGERFIQLHRNFEEDYHEHKILKEQERYILSVQKYNQSVSTYEDYKNGNYKCICKGNIRLVKGYNYEFIGCDNYQEEGFNHFKMSYPYTPKKYNVTKEEFSTSYLFKLKIFYNLPALLKESLLTEYLIMSGEDLYADLISRFNLTRSVKQKSNSRERIIKEILKNKFEKVSHQQGIKIKFTGEKERLIIPDFICIKNNNCYLIEQKKNIDNVNNYQTEIYFNALSYLIKTCQKDYILHYFNLIEEGYTDILNNIININDLKQYEFN